MIPFLNNSNILQLSALSFTLDDAPKHELLLVGETSVTKNLKRHFPGNTSLQLKLVQEKLHIDGDIKKEYFSITFNQLNTKASYKQDIPILLDYCKSERHNIFRV